jgi:hypothetical protein
MKHMKLLIILAVLMGLLVSSGDLFSKVIRVYASVNPTSFKGECPKVFEFTGKIASDSPGIVKYKWLRSDNAQAPEQTINFNAPGTQIVTTTWTLGGPGMTYNGWEAIQILSPNPMTSNKAAFTLKCGVGCGIIFKSLSKTSGYPGDTFKMYGKWGPTQGTKTPCINKGGPNKLIVLSWSDTVLEVRIPTGLAPGKYRVGVYCKFPITEPTGGSTWKDFTILYRTIKPLQPVQTLKPGMVKPGLITTACPDPAAHEIRFRIVRRYTQLGDAFALPGLSKISGEKPSSPVPTRLKPTCINCLPEYLVPMPPAALSLPKERSLTWRLAQLLN